MSIYVNLIGDIMKKLIILSLLLTLSACTSYVANVTAISTREVNPNEVNLNNLPTVTNVEGQHEAVITILNFWNDVELSKAVEDALTKGNGDLLINGQITLKRIFILIGTINTLKIKGDVVNTNAKAKK